MKYLILFLILVTANAFGGQSDGMSFSEVRTNTIDALNLIAFNAKASKKLAAAGDTKGACIVSDRGPTYDFGFYGQQYKFNLYTPSAVFHPIAVAKLGDTDFQKEENDLYCRISIIASACSTNSDDLEKLFRKEDSCGSMLKMSQPQTANEVIYQNDLLIEKVNKLLEAYK